MPKLVIAFASATLLLAGSGIWKANAATIATAGTLAPLTKSYAPAEKVPPTAIDTHGDITAVATGVATTAMATAIGLITAMATDAHIMATATGHTVITATDGDQASPSVSDEAGGGATKDYATHEDALKEEARTCLPSLGFSYKRDEKNAARPMISYVDRRA